MFASILKDLRKEYNLTQEQLAKMLSISKSAISMYELGQRSPDYDMLLKIAEVFNVDVNYLFGQTRVVGGIRPITKKKLPMLGNVACGEPIFANEEHETFIDANADLDADFCLTAKGDSMINARIFDGDLLFVKSQNTVENGEIAVVLIENEATVKRVYYDKENNVITLVPENPTHKPLRYIGTELDQIRILGKVIAGQYSIE